MTQADIPLTEEFTEPDGEFTYYDAIPVTQQTQLRKQKHVDIRSMYGDASTVSIVARDVYMLFVDSLSMNDLSLIQMEELDAQVTIKEGEQWSVGTWSQDATRHHWNVLSIPCTSGSPAISRSVIRD